MSEDELAPLQRQIQRERTARKEAERLLEEKSLALYRANQQLQRDITGRKQAEDRIQFFRRLLDHSSDCFFIVDPATSRILDVNEAACRDLRYSRDELLQRGVVDIQTILDDATWQAHAQRLRAQGQALMEFDALRKDGSQFPVEASLKYLTLKDQEYIIAVVRDISERKRAEEALLAGEERLQLEISRMPIGYIVWDTDFRVVTWNPAAEKIFGFTADEARGRHPYELIVPKAVQPYVDAVWRRLCAGDETAHSVNENTTQDGRTILCSWTNTPLKKSDGTVLGVLSMVQDISERKQAEEALRLSALKHQLLFESSRDALMTLAPPSWKFTGANQATVQLFGASSVTEFTALGPWDVSPPQQPDGRPSSEKAQEMIATAMREGSNFFEWTHQRLNGRPFAADVLLTRMKVGEEVFLQATVRDISERKRMEQDSVAAGIRLKKALTEAIGAIAGTLEQRDPYTAGHQRRVAELAAAIGAEMELAPEVTEGIHFGGLIHDIGKISVPTEILIKPGQLTDIEFGLIQVHPEAGYEIVKGIVFPWPVAAMVRQHHERLDGSGYPQGLKGDQIALEARILAVADVVEAMSADRPYRPGRGLEAALDEIMRGRGMLFDPVAVDACLRLIREKGFAFSKA